MPQIDGMNWNPVWLPDGRLSFTSMRKGDFDVYVKDVGGSGRRDAHASRAPTTPTRSRGCGTAGWSFRAPNRTARIR